MANPSLELLIALGIDNDKTKDNIRDYIKQLKNLPDIDVALNISGSKESTKQIEDLRKIIENLNKEVDSLNRDLKNIGNISGTKSIANDLENASKSAKKIGDELNKTSTSNLSKNIKKDYIEILDDFEKLDDYLNSLQVRVKIHENSKGDITKYVAQVKNEFDQIETLTIKPQYDIDNSGNKTLEKFNVSSMLDDSSTYKINESLENARVKLKEIELQGSLSANEIANFNKRLSEADSNTSIDDIVKEFKLLAKESTQIDKVVTAIDKAKNKLEELGRQGLLTNNQMSKFLKDLSSDSIDSVGRVNDISDAFSKLAKNKNIDDSLVGQLQKVNNEIDKLHKQGLISNEQRIALIDTATLKSSVKELQNFSTELKGLGQNEKAVNDINFALSSISPTVDRLTEKLNLMVNKLGGNVDSTGLSNVKNNIESISNMKINSLDDIGKLNGLISDTEKSITQLTVSSNHMERFKNKFKDASDAIRELERGGYASEQAIEKFKNTLSSIPTGDLAKVKELIKQIDDESEKISRNNEIVKFVQSAEIEIQKLQAQITKTQNLYKSSYDRDLSKKAIEQLDNLRSKVEEVATLANQDTDLVKTKHFDDFNTAMKQAVVQVKDFNAHATTSVRSSIGLIDALKQAYSKFPV